MGGPVRVKVCCIAGIDEASMAIRCGASALGLVSQMPSGPGVIPWERITEIAAFVPPPVATFLLTCSQSADEIIDQQRRTGATVLQLCDALPDRSYAAIRRALPGAKIVQVIHVRGEEAIDEARDVQQDVDALLLDSGNPSLDVKQLGGTGRVHDWSVSARLRAAVSVPVFLAGGLNAGNAADAIAAVRPFGLDVCSGVRTNGRLDETKLRAFIAACGPNA